MATKRRPNKGGQRNSRSKKPHNGGYPRKEKDCDKQDRMDDKSYGGKADVADHSNDVSWYSHNPEMLRAAGSYGFSYIAGQRLPFQSTPYAPGVMWIEWEPSMGGDNIDALQRAKDAIFSFVVHANSRNQSYDANDLMMTILAGKDVFNILSSMIRAYGVANNYSEMNRYTPDGLLSAMGFDPVDFRQNLSQIWFDINNLIAQATQIWVPSNIPLISRQFWMNANVYLDADTYKAQYYMYVQAAYYMLDETSYSTGTALSRVTIDDSVAPFDLDNLFTPGRQFYTWAQWRSVAQRMINALVNSQDRGIMFGDIIKAYGKESLYAVGEIPSNYRLAYTYNREVLSQMENTTQHKLGALRISAGYIQEPVNVSSPNVASRIVPIYINGRTTEPTKVKDNAQIIFRTAPEHVILNFHQKEVPTPEQIMVATRMTIAGCVASKAYVVPYNKKSSWLSTTDKLTLANADGLVAVPTSTGTEVCTDIRYSVIGATGGYSDYDNNYLTSISDGNILRLGRYTVFDWAPFFYCNSTQGLSNNDDIPGSAGTELSADAMTYLGDLDNFTVMGPEELLKLHTTAVYSEFGVPVI